MYVSLYFMNSIYLCNWGLLSLQSVREGGTGVATGEACQNRVMFKQFLMSGAMQFCQVFYIVPSVKCMQMHSVKSYIIIFRDRKPYEDICNFR